MPLPCADALPSWFVKLRASPMQRRRPYGICCINVVHMLGVAALEDTAVARRHNLAWAVRKSSSIVIIIIINTTIVDIAIVVIIRIVIAVILYHHTSSSSPPS